MPKKVLVALPPGLLEQIDFVAGCEHRNRSDLIRESLRRYINEFKRDTVPRERAIATIGDHKIMVLGQPA